MSLSRLCVLLDGWDLVYQPLSPAAFHLLEILEALQGQLELVLAIPAKRPLWLPERVKVVESLRSSSALDHLRWVQMDLPRLARQAQANIIHTVQAAAPLFAAQVVLYSPTQVEQPRRRRRTFWERVDEALGSGGLVRAISVEPERIFGEESAQADTGPSAGGSEGKIGAASSAVMRTPADVPFFLYQSRGNWETLQFLLQVWSKAAAHLGDQAVLAVVCASQAEIETIHAQSAPEFLSTLQLFVDIDPPTFLALLEKAIALIQLQAEPRWGGTAARAISLGVPIVGFELPSLGEAVGPAGYLTPEGDERALLAALLTVVVEDEVLTYLQSQAQHQARRWNVEAFRKGMLRLYRQAVGQKF